MLPLGPQTNVWAATSALAKRIGTSPRTLSSLTVVTTPPPTSMYRNTIAWFSSARQKPGPLCICTSVNAAAQLVAAGIGVGIFPKRMIEAYRPSGALAVIATKPQLAVGRVYLAHHVTADTDRTEAVMRIIESVTADLNLPGFTAVNSIKLDSVDLKDGSTWTLADLKACIVTPDRMMLVANQ